MTIMIVALVAVVATIAICLLVLRRRGGSGERGAAERGMAQHELARALGNASIPGQALGPSS
ncbi:hypothetical protein ABT127_04405 [Streptomyces sp. NPDC001904]|uniref:hypothetical protein n=1 Tax=Streptomyces sp. NPDC001904 TaxID=3154531 RepID=UPI0033334C3A